MNRLIYILSLFFFLLVISCSDSSQKKSSGPKSKRELYRSALTPQDSSLSRKLVITFMDFVQKGKYADAVMMLNKLDEKEPYSAPELLDNDEIEEIMKILKQFPILSYSIVSITYDSAVNNPIRCMVLVNVPKSAEPIRITWVFNPINYEGEWKLCFPKND